jgi:hypothetical protein
MTIFIPISQTQLLKFNIPRWIIQSFSLIKINSLNLRQWFLLIRSIILALQYILMSLALSRHTYISLRHFKVIYVLNRLFRLWKWNNFVLFQPILINLNNLFKIFFTLLHIISLTKETFIFRTILTVSSTVILTWWFLCRRLLKLNYGFTLLLRVN